VRGLQPARWGGGELHPGEFYGEVIEVARAEGCAGWVAGIIDVHPWQTALYETQQEIWGNDPTTMYSSSYAPTGIAERAGGFRLSCRWANLATIAGGLDVDAANCLTSVPFCCPARTIGSTTTGMSPDSPAPAARTSSLTRPSFPIVAACHTGT